MRKRTSPEHRGTRPTRSSAALARSIAALPPAKRAAVADFIDRLLDADRALVRGGTASSEAAFGRVWDNPDDAEYDRL